MAFYSVSSQVRLLTKSQFPRLCCLEIGMWNNLPLGSFSKLFLLLYMSFHFHLNFQISLSISVQKPAGILTDCLDPFGETLPPSQY